MTLEQMMIAEAIEQRAHYPQYNGYFDGSKAVIMKNTVKTGAGNIIAEKDEPVLLIAKEPPVESLRGTVCVYSLRQRRSGFVEETDINK